MKIVVVLTLVLIVAAGTIEAQTAGEGSMCSGFAGVQCRAGLFCDYSLGSAGICRRRNGFSG
ncbi:hypothetical protein DPMN_145442 [Dreissena polymorpha]|uniref:Uncharacterized protein n=1 Tax=Dreissena polymorpha TaxID=45954 RepID=A0A9D4F552_DREPO|nr:hypothetical protein DPMN_145442 [Dreissena polymorpha]